MKNILSCTVVLILIAILGACFDSKHAPDINHAVTFKHKGSKTGKDEQNTLFEKGSSTEHQHQQTFYMDVVSVYCGEDICKVDPVRLHWNALGFYSHFSLKNGVELEKAFGDDFTEHDYKKLNLILKNKNSALASLHKEELVREIPSGNAIDALSGATVTILKDDYVDGAIWTCFTLWHFANGEVSNIIRNITGNAMTVKTLNLLLKSNDFNKQQFAIEQLQRKKVFDETSVNNILNLVANPLTFNQNKAKAKAKASIYPTIINFVNTLPNKQYFQTINQLISIHQPDLSVRALLSLTASSKPAPNYYYETLSNELPNMRSYQEIDLFLTLVNTKLSNTKRNNTELAQSAPIYSNALLTNISELLSHQRFSIARRVYWFLSQVNQKQLSKEIQQSLNQFYQKNNEKL